MTDNVKKIIEILDKAVVFDTKVYDMTSLAVDFSIIASSKTRVNTWTIAQNAPLNIYHPEHQRPQRFALVFGRFE